MRKYLETTGAAAVLDDPRLEIATAEIDGSPDRPRAAVQADLARKESARKALARTHATNQCPPDDLLAAVYSLADHHTYLLYNRDPVERMIEYLQMFFSPRKIEGNWSLAISSGAHCCRTCASLGHRLSVVCIHSCLPWSAGRCACAVRVVKCAVLSSEQWVNAPRVGSAVDTAGFGCEHRDIWGKCSSDSLAVAFLVLWLVCKLMAAARLQWICCDL